MAYRAFTLIELLTVTAIIAVLAGILFPVLAAAKAQSKTTACASNLHQLYLGLDLYANDVGDWQHLPLSLVPAKAYVPREVFKCPEHEPTRYPHGYRTKLLDISSPDSFADFPISYAYVRQIEPVDKEGFWIRLLEHPSVGVLACPFHGSVNADFSSPALMDLQPRKGIVNRVCVDGHLVRFNRQETTVTAVQDLFYRPLSQVDVLREKS